MDTTQEAVNIWWYINPAELTPPDGLEIAAAVKLVDEITEMMDDFKIRLDKLRRNNVRNLDG